MLLELLWVARLHKELADWPLLLVRWLNRHALLVLYQAQENKCQLCLLWRSDHM